MDVEALGAATTAGLVSSAIERPAGQAGEAHHLCADCGHEVTGRFCSNCGQPAHVHRTILHLGEELLHGVMHFDSRIWRTAPLLVLKPGKLTREWVHGKRTRYVSPLAAFLFTVFVMFMMLSYAPAPTADPLIARAQINSDVASKTAEVVKAERALSVATPEERAEAEAAVKEARKDLEEAAEDLKDLNEATAKVGLDGSGNWKDKLAQSAKSGHLNVNLGNKKLEEKVVHKLENPELALYKLQQTFYKFSFLLVPLSIPFVALLFLWKRGFTLYDHGVFVLYSLTFMSLLVMVAAIMLRLGGGWAALTFMLLPWVVPAHMFFQLKGAYSLRIFSALWRTFFLLIFCSIVLMLFVLTIIYLGLI